LPHLHPTLGEMAGDDSPRSSYAVTAVAALFIFCGMVLTFLLQIALAVVMSPLLLWREGRHRFFHVQSFVFRGVNASIGLGMNPLWCTEVQWMGQDPGPPKRGKGSIIFVNHRSNADPWFSSWALTKGCIEGRFVYKSSLKKVPFLGCCAQLAGDLDVKFGDKQQIKSMLDRAKDIIESGYNIVVFPEGTRSPSGILQEFKPSFFRICAELGCPAVPMCMVGTERAWPLNGMRMGLARVRTAVGGPLYADGPEGADRLAGAVEERMCEMARALLGDNADSEDTSTLEEGQGDPFVTGRPYSYWRPPPELESLALEEQVPLLRTGKTHERGAHLL